MGDSGTKDQLPVPSNDEGPNIGSGSGDADAGAGDSTAGGGVTGTDGAATGAGPSGGAPE